MGLTSWATIERHGGGAWSSWTKVVNSNPSALGMPRGVQLALAPNGDMMLLTNGGPLKWQRKPAGGAWSDPAELPGSDVSDPGNIYGYGIDMSSVRLRATASSAFVATWNHQYTHSQYAAVAARDVGFSKADDGEASNQWLPVKSGAVNVLDLRLPVRHELGGNTGDVQSDITTVGHPCMRCATREGLRTTILGRAQARTGGLQRMAFQLGARRPWPLTGGLNPYARRTRSDHG